jgi:allantoinase
VGRHRVAATRLAVWTEARRRGPPIERVAQWMSRTPAQLAGLAARNGAIRAGCDPDFALWDPEEEFVVDAGELHHRHKLTPYAGRRLAGAVKSSYLRGRPIRLDGRGPFCRRD